MELSKQKIKELVELLHKWYPKWKGFSDPEFMEDEINYKKATIEKAKELLSEAELKRLIDEKKFDEFIERLDTIGKDNNLLWRSVPMKGDLGILYQPELDKPSFCNAVSNLLYGKGASHLRLKDYTDYVKANKLPNKWTFPTYFLFICHPDTEMFVKPRTIRWLFDFVGGPKVFTTAPTPPIYTAVKQLARQLKEHLEEYEPRDMVDIQSLIWTCYATAKYSWVSEEKRHEFRKLFAEFLKVYPHTEGGKSHIVAYEKGRKQGVKNFEEIVVATSERGEDVTDRVILKLLPYADTEENRKKGAWIHVAPGAKGDIKAKYEGAGWTKPKDWPNVAKEILKLVQRCNDDHENLEEACKDFESSPYSKGFQTGVISPILNALNPDKFLIINNKPRQVINYLTDSEYSQRLTEYPELNDVGRDVIEELAGDMHQPGAPKMRDDDLFDMFCHWLVAVKKHSFEEVYYWKIAPGEDAWNWEACKESGFIAMGWDEMGDVWKLSRAEFNKLRDKLVKKHPDWKKVGVNQVWVFARHIKVGDRIVANHGISEVLGIGTVTGSYYFVPGVEFGHRIPVQWDDLTPRKIDEGGWRRTIVELDAKKFQEIANTPSFKAKEDRVFAKPHPEAFFTPKTFELLSELHDNPTYAFYKENKDEFKQHVEEPFKALFLEAASNLPNSITDVMETQKRIFALIPKNDYGRGGANDYYWGAFYPKGGKRTHDAQLFAWMNYERLEFGFYIGEYGSEQRKRFVRNCKENREAVVNVLRESLADDLFVYGRREDFVGGPSDKSTKKQKLSWNQWLENPEQAGIHVAVVLPKDQVLQSSPEILIDQITKTFERLFPLVTLATSDDPLPAIGEYLEIEEEPAHNPEYALAQIAEDTGFDKGMLDSWIRAIHRKGQAIFYGPPGTGKTYIAEKLAQHLIGGGDGFMDIIQFHPAYAYEDFMQGIRPKARADGGLDYPTVKGRFLNFCDEARKRSDYCVLILDEINRANLARVFGELMYLLEYRDRDIHLADGGRFQIPSNVRIIGTMNTADRSIALVDHALRRRFAFLALYPKYDVLSRYHQNTGFPVEGLIEALKRLNNQIADRHYHVGITFFLRENLKEQIADIWRMEIEPYLEEYFFDQPDKVDQFRWDKVKDKILS